MSFLSKDSYKKMYIFSVLKFRTLFPVKHYKNSSSLTFLFTTSFFFLYNGKNWRLKAFKKLESGHKLGEFVWTRKIALYKNKQKKKKSKKK